MLFFLRKLTYIPLSIIITITVNISIIMIICLFWIRTLRNALFQLAVASAVIQGSV